MPWPSSLWAHWPDNKGVHLCPVSQSVGRMTSHVLPTVDLLGIDVIVVNGNFTGYIRKLYWLFV